MKYLQQYANNYAVVPQAEWYAMMQCNYFSNHIRINDRFLFGTMNGDGTTQAFIVKAVIKSETEHTFVRDFKDELNSTPLITLAFDKVPSDPDDNPVTRIAAKTTVYKVDDSTSYNTKKIKSSGEEDLGEGERGLVNVGTEESPEYAVNFEDFAPTKHLILQGETESYAVGLFMDGDQYGATFEFDHKLTGPATDTNKYYEFTAKSNSFTVKNKKAYKSGKLVVTAKAYDEETSELLIQQDYEIKLGGFY